MLEEATNSKIRNLGKRAAPEVWVCARANLKSDPTDHETDGIIMLGKVVCKL